MRTAQCHNFVAQSYRVAVATSTDRSKSQTATRYEYLWFATDSLRLVTFLCS